MPKVHGTGPYEFRRPRAAEYPFPAEAPAPATAAAPDKVPAPTGGASITLLDIQRDRLTRVAAEHWGTPAAAAAFDADLVREIYATELRVEGRGRKTVPLHRVMILEVSQYLENYLWPHFDPPDASFEHVMSIILMVNEKFRENVAAWTCFHDRKDAFKGFLWRVLKLKEEERALNMAEKTNYLLFMINAFQSLEDELVRETILQLVSLKLWNNLSFGRLQMELCLNPELIKKWTKIKRKEAKEAKKADQPTNPAEMLENKFLRNLIEEFLEILDSKVILSSQDDSEESLLNESLSGQIDDSCVLYCERFVEFLIDMLSQLPTRRFLRPLVADVAVVAKCHLSALYTHEKGRLFAQLVDLLQFYESFEINDHSGTQLADDDVLQAHYSRFQAFQLLAFKQVPKLRDFALSSIGSLHKRADLTKKLLVLSDVELQDLVCNKLKLISEKDPCSGRRDFLIEVLVAFFEKRQSQKDAVNALPLYPNEQIMWDESLVPSINYSGEGCLALPKLNLQFLTLHDYLLRNFNLFRLESTYEIREDIQEAVPHLHAYINNEGDTAFRGWSRMAVPIKEFKITEVKQPNIGEVKPSAVTADVTFSISSYRHQIKSEWDALKEHDVLFLLSIRPSFEPLSPEEAAKSTVPERLGLQYVRGCEVIEIHDEEGTLMNDFTGRIKREEWKPPKGDIRTVRIALDTAQYHIDVTETAEKGAENVYGTFNILMRRKPKENNFKAILESIRDLMNETCVVPEWLHNIFLGYGNPSAAQWINMPDLLEVIDFKDTFLDAKHVQQSFPDYQVTFINSDGTENLHPSPPFKIRLSKKIRENSHALPGNVNSKNNDHIADGESQKEKLIVETYVPADPGPYPQDKPKQNSVRFTPTQIGAIISGVQPGLTMVVGPPGTGKTDTAVQILNVLYHNCPSQRTLIITHSNQALNDLFEKIMQVTAEHILSELLPLRLCEYAPSPWFYQNEGEAEYIVSVYIYMRLIGYPANKISILTTYNGQKLLIRDVINRRCKPWNIEPPNKVTTVDKFQGQQNDFILLSLVRTRFVGHLRDVRRLIVAMSRARLGLYVFCRRSLFEQCYELQPTFQLLLQRPDKLALNLEECTPFTERPLGETGNIHYVTGIEDIEHLVKFRLQHLQQMQYMQYYAPPANELPPVAPQNNADVVPSENGSVLNQPNEHMAVEENGGASDTTVSNKMEEDTVEAKDEKMQEENKTAEGNGDDNVAAEDKGEEHVDANDKMEEGDATSKGDIEEENSEPKDKMDEE
nr:unnamed protein product [Digitaria exilis]